MWRLRPRPWGRPFQRFKRRGRRPKRSSDELGGGGGAGRKKKSGARKPSGQLKPTKKEVDDRTRTIRQPHRRALARELRAGGADELMVGKFVSGEEAESPIGRLWAAGKLAQLGDGDVQASRDRYDAGTMYAQVVGAYRSVIEAPNGGGGSGRGF